MPCKIVLFFRQNASGWTEVYYSAADDPRPIANAFLPVALDFVQLRNRATVLDAIRVSREAAPPLLSSPRVSWLEPVNQKGISGITDGPDLVNATALVRVTTNDNKTRHIWLRGLNDADTIREFNGISVPSPNLVTRMAAMFSVFPNLAWCLKVLSPITVHPWLPVLSFQQSLLSNKMTRVNLLPGTLVPVVGDRVYFRNVAQDLMPGLRGVFIVQRSDPAIPSFEIPYRTRTTDVVFAQNGQWRRAVYTYPAIQELKFQRFADHDTGRPITPSRGRQPARTSRF